MPPEPVEFAAKGRVSGLGLLGSLLFVALGFFLMAMPGLPKNARWTGLANALFFGGCALIYARDLWRPRVALLLDSSGLEHRHPVPEGAFRFAWKTIQSVRTVDHERGSSVVLMLNAPESMPRVSTPDWALAKGAWPSLVPTETTLSPAALGTTAAELADTIERFRRYYGDPHGAWEGKP